VKCPVCKTTDLYPAKLADGLPGFYCSSCEGQLIEILNYRHWCEQTSNNIKEQNSPGLNEPQDSSNALICPQCHKLMTKFGISGKTTNKLDLCSNCGRFWVDGGEWNLIKALNLDTHLTKVFNEPWQKAIRAERALLEKDNVLQKLLSKEDYQQLKRIKDWIDKQPCKKQITEYINQEKQNTGSTK